VKPQRGGINRTQPEGICVKPQRGGINRVSGENIVAYGKAGRAAAAIGRPTPPATAGR
jgi:hypothetical protein